MPETEEEKKKRWAQAAARSAYMTPAMVHALKMSKQQSRNKYTEQFNKTKAKFTPVASTPEMDNAKRQSSLVSRTQYRSEFEKSKAKFTQIADDPETLRVSKVSKQNSNLSYTGKGPAKPRKRNPASVRDRSSTPRETVEIKTEVPVSTPVTPDPAPVSEDTTNENEDQASEVKEFENYDDQTENAEAETPETNQNNIETQETTAVEEIETQEVTLPQNGDSYGENTEEYPGNGLEEPTPEDPVDVVPEQKAEAVPFETEEENIYDQAADYADDTSQQKQSYDTNEYNNNQEAEYTEAGGYDNSTQEAVYDVPEDLKQAEPAEEEQGGNLDNFYANLE
ncbi:uncharacterized protein LOC100184771 [Ciona intestinalis]